MSDKMKKQDKIIKYLQSNGWHIAPFIPIKGGVALSLYPSGGCPYYYISKTGRVRYGVTYKTSKPQTKETHGWLKEAEKFSDGPGLFGYEM
jgi:hypothetical protein